jgi:hypothetical protein
MAPPRGVRGFVDPARAFFASTDDDSAGWQDSHPAIPPALSSEKKEGLFTKKQGHNPRQKTKEWQISSHVS